MPKQTLYYIHDPMCSWCWGFKNTLSALVRCLPEQLAFAEILGGLAPDSDAPMPDEMQKYLQTTWHKIQQRIPETEFNFAFWTSCSPRRSTYPACRAVIAAGLQSTDARNLMTTAIQMAYYTQARNPSDIDVLTELSGEIGLDQQRFTKDMLSENVKELLQQEINRARALNVDSYPSLVLDDNGSQWRIAVDYLNAETMLEQIRQVLQ